MIHVSRMEPTERSCVQRKFGWLCIAALATFTSACTSADPASSGTPATTGGTETVGTAASSNSVMGSATSNGTTSGGMGGGSSSVSGMGSSATGNTASSVTTAGVNTGGGVGGGTNGGTNDSTTNDSTATTGMGGAGTNSEATGTDGTGTGGVIEFDPDLRAPANGALLGVFTPAQSQGELAATEAQIGRSWAIHLGYYDWSLDFTSFAAANVQAGRIPYVTIEPFNVSLDSIASGAQDSVIQSRAQGIRGLQGTVMLRFAHEMNGDWYSWDGYHNGANSSAPAKYIAAYRHIHDVYSAAGVTNVLWIFCPNVDSVPNEPWNAWENYYPGDEYVDWMCYDAYDWGSDTFESMTSRIYEGLAAKNKPILLGETSTQNVEKAAWINAIIPAMQSRFPMLKALVWFHVNKENDWRYDSTAGSLSAFIEMANDPYFNP